MPSAVVVRERARGRRRHIRSNRLVEDDVEPSVGLYSQLPRIPASLDSTVIRRGIRRPPEPRRDREVRGGYRKRRSRDPISSLVRAPPPPLPSAFPPIPPPPPIPIPPQNLHFSLL